MYSRTILVWAAGLPVTAVLFVAVLLSLLADRSGRLVHSIGALWCRVILLLSGVRVRVRGLENLGPAEGPRVFLSNHIGAFDIPVLQAFLPVQFRWVAKKSLFSIPVVGWSMTLAGYIPIERENTREAFRGLLRAAKKIRAGTSVLVFPEGTRGPGRGLLPFKKGAFILARRSGAEVVPLALSGTRDIMKKGSLLIRPAEATLSVGRPFATEGMNEEEIMERARAEILGLLGRPAEDGGCAPGEEEGAR